MSWSTGEDLAPEVAPEVAPKAATRSKRDLFPVDQDNEEASQQEVQDNIPVKRLQQYNLQHEQEFVGTDKILTFDSLQTCVLHALPALRCLPANRLFAYFK